MRKRRSWLKKPKTLSLTSSASLSRTTSILAIGPNDATQWVLNVQPVIPISLNKDWNLITRTIMPIINQPSPAPGIPSAFGSLTDLLRYHELPRVRSVRSDAIPRRGGSV